MFRTIIVCAIYLITTLLGMTLIKSGQNAGSLFIVPFINIGLSFWSILGIVLYGFSFFIFVFFVSKLDISIAIPLVSGLYCAITVIIGRFLFHERVSLGQIIGIIIIIVGTVIVGVSNKS